MGRKERPSGTVELSGQSLCWIVLTCTNRRCSYMAWLFEASVYVFVVFFKVGLRCGSFGEESCRLIIHKIDEIT